jgi:drug/metabolite transporter (DMT)-like permease
LFDFVRPGGESPTANALAGILAGFCGAILLIGWSASGTSSVSFIGAVVVVLGTLFWAAGSIYGKTATLPPSPLLITGMEMLSGGTVLLAIAYALGELTEFNILDVSPRSGWAWLYLTAVAPIAFISYAWLLRNAPIALVATYSYVNPLVALLLGYFLGNEVLAPRVLMAAGLIISSVVMVSARKPR